VEKGAASLPEVPEVILDLLRKRSSVRAFQDRSVPVEAIETILEAGRLSPSGGNEQPWLFGVITDRDRIARVAEVSCGQDWIARAPLLIVLSAVCVGDERGGRDIQKDRFPRFRTAIEEMDQDLYRALNQEEHQTKIAGAHMALAALELGIASCWVSRFDVHRLAGLLGLPRGCMPSEILVFGYPEGTTEKAPRKSIGEVIFRDRYPLD
jgi:nitroreductase